MVDEQRETASTANVTHPSAQVVEISDDAESPSEVVANNDLVLSTDVAQGMQASAGVAHNPRDHHLNEQLQLDSAKTIDSRGKKRKLATQAIDLDNQNEDEDVQIISVLPESTVSRSRPIPRLPTRARSPESGQQRATAWADVIDLDLLPDIRPRSPARTTRHPYSDNTTRQTYESSHQDYGSASQPIDLENYIDNGEGSSRSQFVNGNAVGTFHNGRYIPYRPQVLPYSIPGDPEDHREAPGPNNLYDWDRDINGQRLIEVFRQQRSAQHAQGHIPLPRSLQDFNSHSRQRVPIDYSAERSRFYSQYQEAYEQNQISAEDLNNLLANISDKDIPPEQRVANPTGLTKYLMEHQRVGLTWLIATESGTNKGGILADAMG